MQFDLGLTGLGLLIVMSLGFGVIAQVLVWKLATHWMWLIAATGYFISGLIASEVIFAWATVEELQPQIDGLSFDEALLGGLVIGVPAALVTWYVTRRSRLHQPSAT